MWEYNQTINSDELYHYGVLGMKWGVHRASKRLSNATTKEQRDKAIAKLQKHRTKATSEITKLNKKLPKLQKAVDKNVMKNDQHAQRLKIKSAKLKKKSTGFFVSEAKAQKLLSKAMRLDIKSDAMIAKSNEAKAKLDKNKTMQRLFNEGIANIDKTLKNKK